MKVKPLVTVLNHATLLHALLEALVCLRQQADFIRQ